MNTTTAALSHLIALLEQPCHIDWDARDCRDHGSQRDVDPLKPVNRVPHVDEDLLNGGLPIVQGFASRAHQCLADVFLKLKSRFHLRDGGSGNAEVSR